MPKRIKFRKSDQIKFFNNVKIISNLSWTKLAYDYKYSPRSFRDWARCEYTVPYDIAMKLAKRFKISLPNFRELDEYWYVQKGAKKGGLENYRLYGLVGNRESRRKGGLTSQRKRLENPEQYRASGFKMKKIVKVPKYSIALAELCGVFLGDGGITNNQIKVTLNKKTDKDYTGFVSQLIFRVLKERPSFGIYGSVAILTLSGSGYVEGLEKVGLKRGNKVKHQVSIPQWILNNKKYSIACLRGLMDTDGGVYFHHHTVARKKYINFGLSFCNASFPLIEGAKKILEDNGLKVYMPTKRKLYIYRLSEVKNYFKVIGSSNKKHTDRLKQYLSISHKLAV